MKLKKSIFIVTAAVMLGSFLSPAAGASASPQSPTLHAETTADGQLTVSLTGATVSLASGDLVYEDASGTVIQRESTADFVDSGGVVTVVTPTLVTLTAPPVALESPQNTMRSAQAWTGSWDECMSGYIAGGGIGGAFFGPGGLMLGMVGGAAAAFANCSGLPRM